MDHDEYLRLWKENEDKFGFYCAWAAMQPILDPNHGQILLQAVRLCAIPIRVDMDLASRFLRSKLLGVRNRALLDWILGELLHLCFTHRGPDGSFRFSAGAKEYFDDNFRQDAAAYRAANRIAAGHFREKRQALLSSGTPYTYSDVKGLLTREVFHRLVFEGEKGMRALKRLVTEIIRENKKGWSPIYGDIKDAPRGALWYALNVCADRREFIPPQCQPDVDAFRDQFLALGGKFDRIIVGHKS